MKTDFFKLTSTVKLGFLTAIGFALFLSWEQSHFWQTRDDYGFGFIVPFFVAYVVYERWPSIKAMLLGTDASIDYTPEAPKGIMPFLLSLFFGILCLMGLAMLLLGGVLRASTGPSNPGTVSLAFGYAAYLLGLMYLLSLQNAEGTFLPTRSRLAFVGLFLFPALIWMVSAPMLSVVEKQIKVALLGKVVTVVTFVFDILGYPIEKQGNVLLLPKGHVGVADACSGIRSLTACIFAGSFLAAVFLNKFWKKVLLVVMAMFLAFVTNIGRSLFLTAWAYVNGSESIDGVVHDVAGYAVLGVTCIGLIVLLPLFNLNEVRDPATKKTKK